MQDAAVNARWWPMQLQRRECNRMLHMCTYSTEESSETIGAELAESTFDL